MTGPQRQRFVTVAEIGIQRIVLASSFGVPTTAPRTRTELSRSGGTARGHQFHLVFRAVQIA
jgi:hypothetical protein